MKNCFLLFLFLFFSTSLLAQVTGPPQPRSITGERQRDTVSLGERINRGLDKLDNKEGVKAKITDYKIISIQGDTTFVDTTLTLNKDYKFNYLRRDDFKLLSFANLGQTYNSLSYNFNHQSLMPLFGARARHFNYMEEEDINYYHVPTPLTELLYKTAFEQGQLVDAFFTVNTSNQFNFSIAYKGLRSLGKYQHALTSTGNFRITSNYTTKNKRYNFKAHAVFQDLLNEENGGIRDEEIEQFESGTEEFKDRSVFQVNFEDAENILVGKRFYLNHYYNLIAKKDSLSHNTLQIGNIVSFQDKYFEYDQTSENTDFFGPSFNASNLKERVTLEDFRTQLNTTYSNNILGTIKFNVDYTNFNYGYNKVVVLENSIVIPNRLKGEVIAIGGSYKKQIGGFSVNGSLGANVSGDFDGNYLTAQARYKLNEANSIDFLVNINSKAPNYNYLLYQSNYENYNWFNDFKNVNTKQFAVNLELKKLFNVNADYTTINNYTYFSKTEETDTPTKPFQSAETVNYFRVQLKKDIPFGKFGLNNTVLYQEVLDGDQVLNVPQLITRNTLYYNSHFFKKALFLQTGVTFKYFTKYNMNAYDPLLAEFYVQNNQEFGGFPLMDFFINAKIRQTRIFLKAEHFNSSFTGYNFYAAPNNPYRDFTVRFGLVWNFFL